MFCIPLFQAQEILEERVNAMSRDWDQSMVSEPRVPPHFNLTLDDKTLLTAIQQLTFIQLKRMLPSRISFFFFP